MALVLAAYRGAAEFEGGSDFQKQAIVITKDGVVVKALDAVRANDLVCVTGAVGAG